MKDEELDKKRLIHQRLLEIYERFPRVMSSGREPHAAAEISFLSLFLTSAASRALSLAHGQANSAGH